MRVTCPSSHTATLSVMFEHDRDKVLMQSTHSVHHRTKIVGKYPYVILDRRIHGLFPERVAIQRPVIARR
jgi:hypothetical protein